MITFLFKPFIRIAGVQALLLGLLVISITAVVCSYGHCHFDGLLDTHIGAPKPMLVYFCESLIDWFSVSCTFYVAGLIFSSSKIRIIDVMGTSALARWPMLLLALISLYPFHQPKGIHDISVGLICFSLVALVFTIWMIVLLYQAFVISCNMKGGKAIGSFIGAIILAELFSKFIIFKLYTVFSSTH